MREIQMCDWARPLLAETDRCRYYVLYGGRGSGKSHAIAQALVLIAIRERKTIVCVREHQKNISESSKRVIEWYIERLGLLSYFKIGTQAITCLTTGTTFEFRGMSTSTEQGIRSMEGVDILWFEEAQRMSKSSQMLLYPTIRKPGSEFWFSFNPVNRHDPVYMDFVIKPRPRAYVCKINWEDNPFFPAELDLERKICLRDEPERYNHIWGGEPDDLSSEKKVLPYALLRDCVDAWPLRLDETGYEPPGMLYAGLDVADAGADKNALVARIGPVLFHVEQWSASLGKTSRRIDAWMREHDAHALFYDVGGIGAGIRSHIDDMGVRPYAAWPVNFGSKVEGEDVQFTRSNSNADFFARRAGQLAWALRMRAHRTQRLLEGDDIDLRRCLFIDPKLPGLEAFLAQLTQPLYDEDSSGRKVIDKQPDDAPSPDMYDAAVLAFAQDSRSGLRVAT